MAYLVGSFFLIRKKVIEEVGSFRSVRNAIQEDRELGMRIKNAGYKMKIVRIDNTVSANNRLCEYHFPNVRWITVMIRALDPSGNTGARRFCISYLSVLFL